MKKKIIEKISSVSSAPGVYLMKDSRDKIIYVGKAKNLKKRLGSYFKNQQKDMKTSVLVKKIVSFETIITENETNALILESNLIKRYRPRYNVILKDDKRYPCLRINIKDKYPNITIIRKIKNDGAMYFGPFSSPGAVYNTLKVINKAFKIRKCKNNVFKTRTRPCLNYQIGACLGPCCLDIDKNIYDEIVKEVILFLKGHTPELIKKIKKQMLDAAQLQNFEKAAELRDKMFALEKTLEKQVAIVSDLKDRDIFALVQLNNHIMITLLSVRGGYLIGSRHFPFSSTLAKISEAIETFILQYYEKAHFIPKEILISNPLENTQLLENYFAKLKGEKVRILFPQKGEKMSLIKMGICNAQDKLEKHITSLDAEKNLLENLQKKLKTKLMPNRIECFDNSNISGTLPVAAMVVFENGRPCKSSYRKYKIKSVYEHNDYAYMAEVLKRRYGKGDKSFPFPDLLVLDGGKGQLNIAVSVINELGISGQFDIIGIAKKDEKKGEIQDKIYKPGRMNPVNFGKQDNLLFFLQRIRDEAHRFAVTFHRQQRRKKAVGSILDNIPGVGVQRKKVLLKYFGSIKKIRAATLEELEIVPGISHNIAKAVKNKLDNYQ